MDIKVSSMPKHAVTVAATIVRLPTAVDGIDKDRDNRVVVARPAQILRDAADLVPMVAISVVNRVIAGRSVLSIPIIHHHYHLGANIVRATLHHSRVCRDRLSPTIPVSPSF